MERRLKAIASVWKTRLTLKQKSHILKNYKKRFGIGQHTAINTLNWNGKRSASAVDPKEVAFLETKIQEEIKEANCFENQDTPTLETLIDC